MRVLSKIAKVHYKTLSFGLLICLFLMIPKVIAMPVSVLALEHPYGVVVLLGGIGASALRLVRRKFCEVKRGFDICVSGLALVITAPLIIIFAVLIKMFSPQGPVFYTQQRVGKDGVVFKIYKLRSMIPNAEGSTGVVWCAGDSDPRMIPFVGRLLRKTHIDEIPQFLNVLNGEMSVVGPRPERPEIVESLKKQIPEYEKRLVVKPGITGLAQIRHRYDETLLDVKKKIKLDLLYIRKMCFRSEISILLKTFVVIFKGKVLGV